MRSPKYLSPAAVERRFGIPAATLGTWRYRRYGPAYVKAGKSILYSAAELQSWLDAHAIHPGAADDDFPRAA